MSDYLKNKTKEAKNLHEAAEKKATSGDFAYKLAAKSLESHIDELSQIQLVSDIKITRGYAEIHLGLRVPSSGCNEIKIYPNINQLPPISFNSANKMK